MGIRHEPLKDLGVIGIGIQLMKFPKGLFIHGHPMLKITVLERIINRAMYYHC